MAKLQLRDGGRLEYDEQGDGQAIVFLHGWSLGNEAFGPQRRALSGYRYVAPNLRGHGNSSPFRDGNDIDTLAGDTAELLVALDLDDVVVVGWSMGALVAWQLALGAEGRRVAGIVTIDMVPRVLNGDGWTHGLRAGANIYDVDRDLERMEADWDAFREAYVPKVFAPGDSAKRRALIEAMAAMIAGNDVDSMRALWRVLVGADYVDAVQALDVPTMITYGTQSQVYDEDAAIWMERHIPNSQRVPFRESGHAPHLEEAEKWNETLLAFVNRLGFGAGHQSR